MKNSPHRFVRISALLLGLIITGFAIAQAYPSKSIRLLVPFPPGGPADILGRVIAQKMSEDFGQQVIVDNRPGANTIIAAEAAAKSAPDGYTLLMAIDSTLSMNPTLYTKLPYDPLKDFAPVALIATVPAVLAAHPSFPASSVKELIEQAKAKPGHFNFGAGTITMHVGGELFSKMAGIKMTPVFYKGGNTSVTALMSNEIPLSFEGAATTIPYYRSGKVKLLGVLGGKRLTQLPDVPTIAESGVAGYDVAVWQSIVVRSGTPRDIIDKLNAELGRISKLPETRDRLTAAGIEPTTSTPEGLGEHIRSETAKWGAVIKEIGLKIE
ncbi:MAG: Bug family tripartite tricarboxylate transporter substrate binding protein [Burkholderiales bacterium]